MNKRTYTHHRQVTSLINLNTVVMVVAVSVALIGFASSYYEAVTQCAHAITAVLPH